jgi:bifunctional non-homologous end joining protein LigD
MREDGRSCFGSLQRAIAEGDQAKLRLWAFDLLHLDDLSLCLEPLLRRKDQLAELLRSPAWNFGYVDHVTGSGPEFFHLAAAQQLEGIVSKRIDSIYRPGTRSRTWLKSKSTSYPRNVAWKWWELNSAA